MSVGRRLFASLSLLLTFTALLGVAAIIGLASLSRHFRVAEEQYTELRSLYEIGFRAASLRDVLTRDRPDAAAVSRHLMAAAAAAESLGSGSAGDAQVQALRASILDRLQAVSEQLDVSLERTRLGADAGQWLGQVAASVAERQQRIIDNRSESSAEFRLNIAVMAGLLAATITIALVVGVRQYRSIMRPLRSLELAMAEVSGGRLGYRIDAAGDREFAELGRHFNRMSAAVEELHDTMKQQVELKSRQLVRSEQLASVGYLAAGVAHEVNNPLAIIAGHAQRTLRRMEQGRESDAAATLRLVCEETFRCREIVLRLLQLSRPVDGEAEVMDLAPLVQHAMDLVRPLPISRGREVVYRRDESACESSCAGFPSQMIQVLVNLMTNALEACPEEGGRVDVAVRGSPGRVMVEVADNGCGMTGAALSRAFEPFFTDKPRRGLSGNGLGLSVSHAIIERHDGRLYASSDGPGRGSRFTIDLPVVLKSEGDPLARLEHCHAG